METDESTVNFDGLVEDGKNKKKVVCVHCPSVILNSGDGVFTQIEFPLPQMTRPVSAETIVEDSLTKYWKVANMYDFQNIGFSKTVGSKKFLICAECDMGPIGWFDPETSLSYVSLLRVKHAD